MGIMNLAELLDSSVSILRKYCKSFIVFNLGYWSIAAILLVVMFIVIAIGVAGSMVAAVATGGEATMLVWVVVLVSVLALTMGFCNSVGAIHLAAQEVLLTPFDAAKAIGSSIKSIFRVMGLVTFGVLPMVPLGYGVWKLIGSSAEGMVGKTSAEWVTAIGSADQQMLLTFLSVLLVLIVVLALLNGYITLFTYALQALILEKKSPVAAIRRSVQLVKGRFWYLYGAISLITLVMYGINASLDSFFLMLSGIAELGINFMGLEPGMGFTFVYVYGRGIADFLYALLFNSLGAVVLTQMYYNRVFETEGYDLVLRVSRLPAVGKGQDNG